MYQISLVIMASMVIFMLFDFKVYSRNELKLIWVTMATIFQCNKWVAWPLVLIYVIYAVSRTAYCNLASKSEKHAQLKRHENGPLHLLLCNIWQFPLPDPDHWYEEYELCSSESPRQSPINIEPGKAQYDKELGEWEFRLEEDDHDNAMTKTMTNNGHSGELNHVQDIGWL